MLRGAFGQDGEGFEGVFKSMSGRILSRVRARRSRRAESRSLSESHFLCDFVQPLLAVFDLARDGALTDEPAPVDMWVDVTVCIVAAHEAFTGDGGAMVAQFFKGVAFDVVAEKQIDEGAGSRVVGFYFGRRVKCYVFRVFAYCVFR